jgi:hypothetical protein
MDWLALTIVIIAMLIAGTVILCLWIPRDN